MSAIPAYSSSLAAEENASKDSPNSTEKNTGLFANKLMPSNDFMRYITNFWDVQDAGTCAKVNKKFKSLADQSLIWKTVAATFQIPVVNQKSPKHDVLAILTEINARCLVLLIWIKQSLPKIQQDPPEIQQDPPEIQQDSSDLTLGNVETFNQQAEKLEKELNTIVCPWKKYCLIEAYLKSNAEFSKRMLTAFCITNMLESVVVTNMQLVKMLMMHGYQSLNSSSQTLGNLLSMPCYMSPRNEVAYQMTVVNTFNDLIMQASKTDRDLFCSTWCTSLYFQIEAPEAVGQGLEKLFKADIPLFSPNHPPKPIVEGALKMFVIHGKLPQIPLTLLSYTDQATQVAILETLDLNNMRPFIYHTSLMKRGLDLMIKLVSPYVAEKIKNKEQSIEIIGKLTKLYMRFSHLYAQFLIDHPHVMRYPDWDDEITSWKGDIFFMHTIIGLTPTDGLQKAFVEAGIPAADVERILKELGTIQSYEKELLANLEAARKMVQDSFKTQPAKTMVISVEGTSKDSAAK